MFEKKQDLIETGKEEKKEVRKELIEEKQATKEDQKKQKEKKDLEAMERLLGKRLQKSGVPVATAGAKSAFSKTSPSGGLEKPQVQSPAPEVKPVGFATEAGEKTENDFIHFQCTCGHKVKIPRKFAGLTGKCRRCGKSIQIPGI